MPLKNQSFNKALSKTYDTFTEQAYYKMFPNSILHYLKRELALQEKNILDVGCGNGALSYELFTNGAKQVLGIDVSPHQIAIAKNKYPLKNLTFKVADAYKPMHVKEAPFDAITCMYSFHFIPNKKVLKQACTNLYTNLKAKGVCVFLDITHDYVYDIKMMNTLKEMTSYSYTPNVKEGEIPKLWSTIKGVVTAPNQPPIYVDHIAVHGHIIKETMLAVGFSSVERVPFISDNEFIKQFWGPKGFNHHILVCKK